MKAIFMKVFYIVAGLVVIAAGAAMLVLPGPGWPTIFFGLWLWGHEFAWAQTLLEWMKEKVKNLRKVAVAAIR